jgi:hypothetical protein
LSEKEVNRAKKKKEIKITNINAHKEQKKERKKSTSLNKQCTHRSKINRHTQTTRKEKKTK